MPAQKKKQSRFSKMSSLLNTTTGRLVATILVFAVVGGGIFVFKSFAATSSWTYTIDTGTMEASSTNTAKCKVSKVRDPSFYNSTIANMSCSSDGEATAYARNVVGAANRSYQACAWVKGSGKIVVSLNGLATTGVVNKLYDVSSSGYKKYCSGFKLLNNMNQSMNAVVYVGKKGTFVNIGAIIVELQ